ncbi:hypothetical protein ACT691_06430 [Vibrio metschnikovii]
MGHFLHASVALYANVANMSKAEFCFCFPFPGAREPLPALVIITAGAVPLILIAADRDYVNIVRLRDGATAGTVVNTACEQSSHLTRLMAMLKRCGGRLFSVNDDDGESN